MSSKEKLNGTSAGLRITSNILLLISGLGLGVECLTRGVVQVRWGLALILACVLRFTWMIVNLGARMFGVGCYHQEEEKAWRRIAEDEQKRGLSPVGWRVGRLGCDLYGLFMEEPDGSRRRDV